jgi:prefoldin beta subunit
MGITLDFSKLVQQQTQIEQQLTENKLVKDELDLLEEDGKAYKMVGPVLTAQSLPEAKEVVQKRLTYLEKEDGRISKEMKDLEKQQESTSSKMQGIQAALQKFWQLQREKEEAGKE